MSKSKSFKPYIRRYKKGDTAGLVSVADKMAALDNGKPFYVLILPYPNKMVLDAAKTKAELRKAPDHVARGLATFEQWQLLVEKAVIDRIEQQKTGGENGEG